MADELYHECHEVISQGRSILEDLHQWGFESVASLPFEIPTIPFPQSTPAIVAAKSLAELEASLKSCELCPLCEQRQNVVFGSGNPNASLVLVGEAPGQDEDGQGIPFVGEAGNLLDKILLAMSLTRQDVYLCSVVKCHPVANREPQADEITTCEQFLQQQLQLIQPQIIVTLGRFATHALLKTDTAISKLRGKWNQYESIPVMPTFHPTYLLHNSSAKRPFWEDMKLVMQRLNVGK